MLPLLARLGSWFPPPFQPAFILTLAQQPNGAHAMPRPTDKIARLRLELAMRGFAGRWDRSQTA